MEHQAPDHETLDVLKQFLGQTYGELHKIDSNITGHSAHLTPKSSEFKRIAAQVLDSVAATPQVRTHGPVGGVVPATVALPVTAPVHSVASPDPNQMEFAFDGSATAKSIQNALDRLESKFDKIERKLNQLLENHKA